MPKQFYPLLGDTSLFEETVERNKSMCAQFMVAANKEQAFLAFDQLKNRGYDQEAGVIEPMGRNTAPAIALAALQMAPEDLLLVTPSDHLITKQDAYIRALQKAETLALQDKLVTFGIKPTYPETGFGYIEGDGSIVKSFREKPDLVTARKYIQMGNYYWNSGMFLFKAGVFLEELLKHSPEVYQQCRIAFEKVKDSSPLLPTEPDMLNIPSISIDYAVMEKSTSVAVVPCDIGWSDLGSFDSLYDQTYNPAQRNAIVGIKDPILVRSKNNLIIGQNKKIALIEAEDLLIVDSPDALLVGKRGSSQMVKQVVEKLKEEKSSLLDAPVTVKRPWGSYTTLTEATGYLVRQIEVDPEQNLSIHKHTHRQEHWQVVKGSARVRIEGEEKILVKDQKITIPAGAKHSLKNAGDVPLVVIEIQSGESVDSADIERYGYDWI